MKSAIPGFSSGLDLNHGHSHNLDMNRNIDPDLFTCRPLLRTFLMSLLFFTAAAVAEDKEYYLSQIRQVGVASVKDKDLTYKFDLVFREAPENFWIFFDKQKSQLVLDMYSGKIEAAPDLNVRGSAVFKGIQVANRQTSMSLSGFEALVLLDADSGWHFDALAQGRNVVRITAWKTLNAPKPVVRPHKGARVFFTILAATVASAATFLLIFFISNTGD